MTAFNLPDLRPDCDACAALCCVGLAFDAGEDFAVDKPAGVPCPNLRGHACAIYGRLGDAGFAGCVRYDCQGAGQRALALHDGISWQGDMPRLAPMLDTFRDLRRLHDLIAVLDTAGQLPLKDAEAAERRRLLAPLCNPDMTAAEARTLAQGPLPRAARAFLRSLAHHL